MQKWQKQMVYLTKKALEKVEKEETKRNIQRDVLENYLERFDKAPREIAEFLSALNCKLTNMWKTRKSKQVRDEEMYRWGLAWGSKFTKEDLNQYTENENAALLNTFSYWYGNVDDEAIYLKNVILYGEP